MPVKINSQTERIYRILLNQYQNPHGVCALMGNLYAESGMKPNNLQNSYSKKFGMSDEEYTAQVNEGTYKNFATDKAGYGLAQWTNKARKQNLYGFCKTVGASVGDPDAQLIFLVLELQNYSLVETSILSKSFSLREISDDIVRHYEKPKNITEEKLNTRSGFGWEYLSAYIYTLAEGYAYCRIPEYDVLKRKSRGGDVRRLQERLIALGYSLPKYGADGSYGKETANAVKLFQKHHALYDDGIAGSVTQFCLFEANKGGLNKL